MPVRETMRPYSRAEIRTILNTGVDAGRRPAAPYQAAGKSAADIYAERRAAIASFRVAGEQAVSAGASSEPKTFTNAFVSSIYRNRPGRH